MPSSSSPSLLVRHEGPLAFILLNRPRRLNALSLEMLASLRDTAVAVGESDARAVVIHGEGSSFSAGVDIETLRTGLIEQTDADLRYDAAKLGGDAAAAIGAMPQVTIAALHGNVVGGGLVMAAACDLRIADSATTFAIPEVDLGIPLGWHGIPALVGEIGPMRTKDLVMTGRTFSAEEAASYGLLTEVVGEGESLTVAASLAKTIAEKAQFPVTMTKHHVNEVVAGDRSRDDAIGLIAGIENPESARKREAYVESFDR
ncbi:MAG: enoyl-CoA hydratase/isomerase family protein [Acidimicrobiia bacterium]